MSRERACESCLARTWLLARLSTHLEPVRRRIGPLLALSDEELVNAVAGGDRDSLLSELACVDFGKSRAQAKAVGLALICRCDPAYPNRLRSLQEPPAVLHVAGGLDRFLSLAAKDPVAIVGARLASPYGLEVARSLGRTLGRAGVTVLSGMALGIDSAAHGGALVNGGATVAVMPGSAERPYPSGRRALHRRIITTGAAVSELPPGAKIMRWTFPARNRIIAALTAMTVVVEATDRSGALITAASARTLGRPLGAVPGRVTSPLAAGPNGLLADGASVVRGAQDILDQLFGAGVRPACGEDRIALSTESRRLLSAIAAGHDTAAALARSGFDPERGLAVLASLELEGYVRREAGGRFSVLP